MMYGYTFGGMGMMGMLAMGVFCTLITIAIVWGLVSMFRTRAELAAHDKPQK